MSSGSYFTIYRKHTKQTVSLNALDVVKDEYRKSNQNEFSASSNKIDDFPVLMHASFKSSPQESDEDCSVYYDKDGYVYDKLLEFHFGSSFTCLKEKFRTNPYVFSESSVIVSKNDAEKMLQAIEYVLSEKYSKEFEDVLSNEYVEVFGNGLSAFDDRFNKPHEKVYLDKEGDNWTVSFGDSQWSAEIHECDEEIRFNLKRARNCIRAFLDAECYEWNGHELVLEYSTY